MATFIVTIGIDDVVPNNNALSLREALALAQGTAGADTITFDSSVTSVVIDGGGGPLVIASGQNVTIDGDLDNDGLSDVSLSGSSQTHHFTIQSGAAATLVGLTLTDGAASGAGGARGGDGSVGAAGSTGVNGNDIGVGATGGAGGDGGDGTDGAAGAAGGDAAGSILNFGDLTLVRSLLVGNDAIGGSGGFGGAGGAGGSGGVGGVGAKGRYGGTGIYAGDGGNGGSGGSGGSGGAGGDGGDGGSAAGAVFSGSTGTLRLVDSAMLGNYGRGGYAGSVGNGGQGGNGGRGGAGGDANFYKRPDGYSRLGYSGDGGNGGDGGDGGPRRGPATSGDGGNGAGAIINRGTILGGGAAAIANNAGYGRRAGYFTYTSSGYAGAAGQGGYGSTFGPYDGVGGRAGNPGQSRGYEGIAGVNGVGGAVITEGGSGAVTQVDSVIYVNATNLTVAEGDSGSTAFTFNVIRLGQSNQAAQVSWSITPGAGLTASDFAGGVIPSGNVVFTNGGPNSVQVTIQIAGDTRFEGDEAFTVNLLNLIDAAGGVVYGLGTTTANGVVLNDEPVSIVYTSAARTTIVSEQVTAARGLAALAGLTANQAIEIVEEAQFNDVGARTINAENVTLFADAPFDAALTLGGSVAAFTLVGNAAIDVTGNGANNTIRGNGASNVLIGLGGADRLEGGAGDDTLEGGVGGDGLVGAGGLDTATYASSTGVRVSLDATLVGTGDAAGDGFSGIENLRGSALGADTLRGNTANNVLEGRGGADWLEGADGDDLLIGGAEGDGLIGGAGVDTVDYSASGGVRVALDAALVGTGDAAGDGFSGVENIRGSALGADTLRGNTANNTLDGQGGSDRLEGGDGNDVLIGGAGADGLVGAAGVDTADYSRSTGVRVALDAALVGTGDAAGDGFSGVENIRGSLTGADTLRGNTANNVLEGQGGSDRLEGADGDDLLIGGAGGDGLIGGAGVDMVDYSASGGVRVALDAALVGTGDASGDGFSGIENIRGSALGADTLRGNTANNTLDGQGGSDRLEGADGNDVLVGGAGADGLIGGGGVDTADYSTSAGVRVALDASLVGTGDAAGDGFSGIEGLRGSLTGADTLRGNTANNTLDGQGGSDRLEGGDGNDVLIGGAGSDGLVGAAGVDTADYSRSTGVRVALDASLVGTGDAAGDGFLQVENLQGSLTGADHLRGNAANNNVSGLGGNDSLEGGGGGDFLIGGDGLDTLTGGAGQDSFLFVTAIGPASVDRITDFVVVDDTIRLEDSIFTGLARSGNFLAAQSFTVGSAATTAQHRIVYNSATGALSYDADGTGGTVAVQFATLSMGLTTMTSQDIIIII